MKYKRGAIEIQFNWIFVLIIGAVILTLFSSIILRQKGLSEDTQNILILNNLKAILSGSEVSQGTVNIVKIPETRIEFKCGRYSIGGFSEQLDVMNVFTPSILEGNRLISMTLDFSMPYRITNTIYLTNPKYRYVFIDDNNIAQQIKDLMPDETFSEIFLSVGDPEYSGESKVRFISFDGSFFNGGFVPPDFRSVSNNAVTALNVNGNLDSGEIEFFRKKTTKFESMGKFDYIGQESLLGAIFSDDPEIYTCVINNVFEKINIVTQIYIEKTKEIKKLYIDSSDRCANLPNDPYSLQNLNTILTSTSDTLSSISNLDILNIIIAVANLKEQNKQAQLQSCATIY